MFKSAALDHTVEGIASHKQTSYLFTFFSMADASLFDAADRAKIVLEFGKTNSCAAVRTFVRNHLPDGARRGTKRKLPVRLYY